MVMAKKIVNASLKAKAWTFEAKAKTIGPDSQGQGQDHKNWPRGASRPRPGLEDYITEK